MKLYVTYLSENQLFEAKGSHIQAVDRTGAGNSVLMQGSLERLLTRTRVCMTQVFPIFATAFSDQVLTLSHAAIYLVKWWSMADVSDSRGPVLVPQLMN